MNLDGVIGCVGREASDPDVSQAPGPSAAGVVRRHTAANVGMARALHLA